MSDIGSLTDFVLILAKRAKFLKGITFMIHTLIKIHFCQPNTQDSFEIKFC